MRPKIILGFRDTIASVDPGHDDGVSLQSAARHMNVDYRNAVRVDGHIYINIGWVDGYYSDKVRETTPHGRETIWKSVRDALRKHRA